MDRKDLKNEDMGAFASVADDYLQHGLTKREYIATKAMQGLLTRLSNQGDELGDELHGQPRVVAEWSVRMADALVKELAEAKKETSGIPCDTCGDFPNIIYTTQDGRFCGECKPIN